MSGGGRDGDDNDDGGDTLVAFRGIAYCADYCSSITIEQSSASMANIVTIGKAAD